MMHCGLCVSVHIKVYTYCVYKTKILIHCKYFCIIIAQYNHRQLFDHYIAFVHIQNHHINRTFIFTHWPNKILVLYNNISFGGSEVASKSPHLSLLLLYLETVEICSEERIFTLSLLRTNWWFYFVPHRMKPGKYLVY